jgi:NADH/NAD ratio-sensing transcriptional regulator Rex
VTQYPRSPIKRIPKYVRKVKRLADKRNQANHRDIQNQASLSQNTIHKIIHQDLKLETKNKTNKKRKS